MRKWLPSRLRRRLHGTTAYRLLLAIKQSARQIRQLDRRFISLEPKQPSRGRVLLSFIIDPFFVKPGESVSIAHTHDWESLQMAKTFLELGYEVDVIHYQYDSFVPQRDYDILIDTRRNLERTSKLVGDRCLKILHADTAHCIFQNAAEAKRLLELKERRGVALHPTRYMQHNLAVEHADCVTILGNAFTMSTYAYAKKPMYAVPISTPVVYPWPDSKNFDAVRKHFLWFGSAGFVHKGLDLVLEAFAGMPDYHLTICGPLGPHNRVEQDFERAFHRELYETPNIHTHGWIDVSSDEFVAIANGCIGLVYPSCSEGQNGGVITCMHAGMIPLVSYQSGVDVDSSFGVVDENCSPESVKRSIRMIAELPATQLERMSRGAWEFARAHHTKETFAREYKRMTTEIVTKYSRPI